VLENKGGSKVDSNDGLLICVYDRVGGVSGGRKRVKQFSEMFIVLFPPKTYKLVKGDGRKVNSRRNFFSLVRHSKVLSIFEETHLILRMICVIQEYPAS